MRQQLFSSHFMSYKPLFLLAYPIYFFITALDGSSRNETLNLGKLLHLMNTQQFAIHYIQKEKPNLFLLHQAARLLGAARRVAMATSSERNPDFSKGCWQRSEKQNRSNFLKIIIIYCCLGRKCNTSERWQTDGNKKGAYLQTERNIPKVLRVGDLNSDLEIVTFMMTP